MSRRRSRRKALLSLIACLLLSAGCTSERGLWRGPASANKADADQSGPVLPKAETMVVAGAEAAELALATSRALFSHAAAVVLVGEEDAASLAAGSSAAVKLGVPLLLTPRAGAAGGADAIRVEIGRLAVRTVVPVGAPATTWARAAALEADGEPVRIGTAQSGALPDVKPAAPLTDLVVLALDQAASRAAAATAKATGARVLLAAGPDPRADGDVIKALAGRPVK